MFCVAVDDVMSLKCFLFLFSGISRTGLPVAFGYSSISASQLIDEETVDFEELFTMSSIAVNVLSRAATVAAAAATMTADQTAAARDAIYHVPRRFAPNSNLHKYLSDKCPGNVSIQRTDYNLYVVGFHLFLNFVLARQARSLKR